MILPIQSNNVYITKLISIKAKLIANNFYIRLKIGYNGIFYNYCSRKKEVL